MTDDEIEIEEIRQKLMIVTNFIQSLIPDYEFGILLFKPISNGPIHFVSSSSPEITWEIIMKVLQDRMNKETQQ